MNAIMEINKVLVIIAFSIIMFLSLFSFLSKEILNKYELGFKNGYTQALKDFNLIKEK